MWTRSGVVFAMALGLAIAGAPVAATPTLVILHATVVDGVHRAPLVDAMVRVEGDRIVAVGPLDLSAVPPEALVIDASGQYLVPGFWDMHMHSAARPNVTPRVGTALARLFIANGVTGVRDMGGDLRTVVEWRRARDAGEPVPRIVAAGPIVDGPRPIWPQSIAVSTDDDGRRAVAALVAQGSDFVKVYNLIPRAAYFAIADEATQRRLPFSGHVPIAVTALEASTAGQRSIEHLSGILLACSRAEDALRDASRRGDGMVAAPAAEIAERIRAQLRGTLDTYDDQKAARLFAQFAANGTWQTPTLVSVRAFADSERLETEADARLRFVPASIRRLWMPERDFRLANRNARDVANFRDLQARSLAVVGAMHAAGVEILAGTDTPNPHIIPGFSLHDELELLVRAGLTPFEAIRTATANSARYLGLAASAGTIEPGKAAEVVLLEADPLVSIGNTRRIAGVVTGGRFLSKAMLQVLLEQAALGD